MVTAAETRAATIYAALDAPITIPSVNLSAAAYQLPGTSGNPFYDTIQKVELSSLTEGSVGGSGAFETLMASMKAHLSEEYEKGRITGDQYAKAYVELTGMAMQTGLQFIMGKEQAYWQALLVREQGKAAEVMAVQAAVQLEVVKAQLALARYQAELAQAQYVLTKMQLASEDAKYFLTYQQADLTEKQTEVANQQSELVKEQTEATRAQTVDTRRNGAAVAGTIKRQRDLLEQQRASFQRADEARVAKAYTDVWITQKTVNEALAVPGQLNNTNIGEVVHNMRIKAGLS